MVGVDVDPVLIEAAVQDHPGPRWIVEDLAELDLPARGILERFDAIVCAGNVMTFLAPALASRCCADSEVTFMLRDASSSASGPIVTTSSLRF